MDIARYIGLFLLKNNFCYIHGLGNLELKRRPAAQEGQALNAPRYEVLLTPGGSIDDNLANFIAVNEQISISKASNALRDFSIQARAELQAGGEVVLPAIGKFIETNGRIQFITDPHLQYTPPSVPVVPVAKRAEEEQGKSPAPAKEPSAHSRTTVNWGKIIIWVLILGIVTAGAIFGVRFIAEQQQQAAAVPADTIPEPVPEVIMEIPGAPAEDSTLLPADTTAPEAAATVPAAEDDLLQYKVIINEYDNLPRAEKREKQLLSFGNNVTLATRDSATYYILMPMSSPVSDTARILDSLRRQFNPKGVSVYR